MADAPAHAAARAPDPDPVAPPGATRRRVELPDRGVSLSLLEWGAPDLPLALFSHANGFCAAMWAEVAEALQWRFRVVAVDARGQGHSALHADAARSASAASPARGDARPSFAWVELRDDLVAVSRRLLEESGQPRIALGAGHSFGGTLTLAAEATAPGRFGALLALDPVILPPHVAGAGRGNALAEGARRRRAVFASRAEARAAFAEKAFFASWTERALDLYVDFGLRTVSGGDTGEVTLRCAPEVEAAVFESAVDFDIHEEVARVGVPAGLLWSAKGHFPRALHAAIAERMPRGWIEDADAGHLVLMERPDLVLRGIERVLAEAGLG